MISARTLVLLGAAAGGYWLWSSGEWRALAARVPALASATGTPAATAPAEVVVDNAPAPAPLQVRTWTDEQGVVHFEQAGAAPLSAREHAVRPAGTMADYERALEQQEGITVQDIARARAARERAAQEAEKQAAEKNLTAGTDDGTDAATQQARELMKRYNDGLEKIRATNGM